MTFDVLLVNPSQQGFAANIQKNRRLELPVVQKNAAKGKHLVIAGAGPSLADNIVDGDEVWACNSALTWMVAHNHHVTHGFAVEQKPEMVELWREAPAVGYLLASSVSPELTGHLLAAGRKVRFFHNTVALQEQDRLYQKWPETVCAGSGLNAVTRALDVALYMGFKSIAVIGADCAMRGDAIHVGGGTPEQDECSLVTMEAEIDGRRWVAQPDLWISANWLVRMTHQARGRIRLLGDTLPNALIGKPTDYLDRLPHMAFSNGDRVPMPAY